MPSRAKGSASLSQVAT